MPKNIVICCDGNYEAWAGASNVLRLYWTLRKGLSTQVVYFNPGLDNAKKIEVPAALSQAADLASFASGYFVAKGILDVLKIWGPISRFFQKGWNKFLALLFGSDVASSMEGAYAYLMETYEPDDVVFIFGFSRGAYAACALGAVLHMYGLLWPGNEALRDRLFGMLRRGRRAREEFDLAPAFKASFARSCRVRFLGIWDTVSSAGWLYNPIKLPYITVNPNITVVRHAVSIDERRAFFRPLLWSQSQPNQDVKQVWFAGVHGDVGGGYPDVEAGLSKITLEWMLNEAIGAGLHVDMATKEHLLGVRGPASAPDPRAHEHRSLYGRWWFYELWPKRYWNATSTPPGYAWELPLGRPRYISPGSLVHESVIARMKSVFPYQPANLPQYREVVFTTR